MKVIEQSKLESEEALTAVLEQNMPTIIMSDFSDIRSWRLMNRTAEKKLRGRGIRSFKDLFDSGLTSKELSRISGFNSMQIGLIGAIAKFINYKDWK